MSKPKPLCRNGGPCLAVPPGRVLEKKSCRCGKGYANVEGTFIPGSLVRSGLALTKEQYADHKECEICRKDPEQCLERKSYLSKNLGDSRSRALASAYELDYYEFFVPKGEVSPRILHAFLEVNAGGDYAFQEIQFEVSFSVCCFTCH